MATEIKIKNGAISGLLIAVILLGAGFVKRGIELRYANETIATWNQSGKNWSDHARARNAVPAHIDAVISNVSIRTYSK